MPRRLLLVAAGALWFVGCSSDEPQAGDPSVEIDDGTVALPSDAAYTFAEVGLGLTRSLTSPLVDSCMEQHGFSYPITVSDADDVHDERRYGLNDAAGAAKYGYGSEAQPEEADVPGAGLAGAERAAYDRALAGEPDDRLTVDVQVGGGTVTHEAAAGCAGEALAELYGSRQNYLDVLAAFSRIEDFSNRSLIALQASGLYSDEVDHWHDCMKAIGYTAAATPYDAYGVEYVNDDDERRAAAADVTCKTERHMTSKFRAFERAWQDEHLVEISGDIELVQSAIDSLQDRARNAG